MPPNLICGICSFIFLISVGVKAQPNEEPSVYTVLTLSPTSDEQLEYLKNERISNGLLDFWKEPGRSGVPVHIMLHSDNLYDFRNQLKLRNISHDVMIEDVEGEIKKLTDISLKGASIYSHSTKDVHKFDFGRFHPFQDILNYVEALAKEFPDRVQVTSIGKSHENRDIPVIKISTLAKPQP